MRGAPRRFLKENMANVRPQCCLLHPLLCLFMDEEAGELGDGLEDLGIEIGVESHSEGTSVEFYTNVTLLSTLMSQR